MEKRMYWVYEVQTFTWRNQLVHAQLETPPPQRAHKGDCGYGFPSPLQDAPYGINLDFTFTVNPKHPHPDNYANGTGFTLFSDRLIQVMRNYQVNFESFPVRMVDQNNRELQDLHYAIFHSLEGKKDAMDKEKSGWQGNPRIGIPRLVLDYDIFDQRPLFICDTLYIKLIRDDLKKAIEQKLITGFSFIEPEKFHSGKYGVLRFSDAQRRRKE
jgi:hypothetical protein